MKSHEITWNLVCLSLFASCGSSFGSSSGGDQWIHTLRILDAWQSDELTKFPRSLWVLAALLSYVVLDMFSSCQNAGFFGQTQESFGLDQSGRWSLWANAAQKILGHKVPCCRGLELSGNRTKATNTQGLLQRMMFLRNTFLNTKTRHDRHVRIC